MGVIQLLNGSTRPPTRRVLGGKGNPGPKTQVLIDTIRYIERVGLFAPEFASIIPRVFRNFLERSGALKEENLEEAKRKVMSTEFNEVEKGVILDAVLAFHPKIRSALMVRSDECALGTGLWYSGATGVNIDEPSGDDLKELVKKVEFQIKMVLASDFDESVRIFKQKMRIKGNPGVLLMPIYGDRRAIRDTNVGEETEAIGLIVPPIHIDYLGRVNGNALVSIGAGIGGANEAYAAHEISGSIPFERFLYSLSETGANWRVFDRSTQEIRLVDVYEILSICKEAYKMDPGPWNRDSDRIGELADLMGGASLEVVRDGATTPYLVVVQAAPHEFKAIDRPEVKDEEIVARYKYVMGTGTVHAKKIRIAERIPTKEDREFNDQNPEGYILIVKTSAVTNFFADWSLPFYSNASAIILSVAYTDRPLGSHNGSIPRALNIPMVAEYSSSVLEIHKGSQLLEGDFILYVNEFATRGSAGFLAMKKQNE